MTLGENLQSLRKEAGLSQEEVAQRLFVSRQSVSKWELNQAEPGVEYLKAMAELYGVTLDCLAGMPLPPPQPEPIPEENPGPEGESGISLYWILFGVRTVMVALENVLFSLPRGSLNFPIDWIAMLAGLFVRKQALWWVAEVCLWINLAIGAVNLFIDPFKGAVGLIQAGAFLYAFSRRKLKAYFHMPLSE